MKNRNKIIAIILLCFMLPCFIIPSSAMAPLPPTEIFGKRSFGVRFPTDAGLIIENQTVSFDLSDPSVYDSKEEIVDYRGSVTTDYTLYNPTDKPVTLKLGYILNRFPNDTTGESRIEREKYRILIDGEEITPELRHGIYYAPYSPDDDFSEIIHDELINDEFCSPNMTVTKYTFRQSDVEKDYAGIGFVVSSNKISGRCLYLGDKVHDARENNNLFSFKIPAVENGETFDIYVFGEELDSVPSWRVYTSVREDTMASGKIELVSKETLNLYDYLLSYYDPSLGISENDFFNMEAAQISLRIKKDFRYITFEDLKSSFADTAVAGYVYEITIAPGERVHHTITAPVYPTVETAMNPETFYYAYDFYPENAEMFSGKINININTPYYIISNNDYYSFEKTENGYSLTLSPIEQNEDGFGTVHGGVFFTLCESENPETKDNDMGPVFVIIILIAVFFASMSEGLRIVLDTIGGWFR